MTFDYIIIGGGITGVTAGLLLRLSGVDNFIILEAGAEAGGLCRTRKVGSHVLDVGGGHFLCSKHQEVYDLIFSLLPKEAFNTFTRVSRVALDGVEIDYPLESNLWQLPPEACADYLISVAQNGEARGLAAPADFEAWIRWKLGYLIAEKYMLPYNRKIWGVPASDMDIDWLHKIPRIDLREITVACLRRTMDRSKMPSHDTFYYPKAGGFQEVFDALASSVRDRIHLSTPANLIERRSDMLLINGRLRTRAIINTAPWSPLASSPIFDDVTRTAISQLRHNEIVVSLHEEGSQTNAHWLYQPDEFLPHHRSFFISNFAPHSGASGVFRETNSKRWQPGGGEIFSHFNDHAYPIPTLGWAAAINRVLTRAKMHGVHGLGRWGQWQYFNSDVCIKEAMDLVTQLGHGSWKGKIKSK